LILVGVDLTGDKDCFFLELGSMAPLQQEQRSEEGAVGGRQGVGGDEQDSMDFCTKL
jgi:hypothetical protein